MSKQETKQGAADRAIRNGFKPKLGAHVRLWDGPGLWAAWSKGSASGTWFVQPVDNEAKAACSDPALLTDIAENVWSYAAEVRTSRIGSPSTVEKRNSHHG